MAGMVLRKTVMVLLTILKWILRVSLVALKLVFGMAKLFLLSLLFLVLAVSGISAVAGVTAERR